MTFRRSEPAARATPVVGPYDIEQASDGLGKWTARPGGLPARASDVVDRGGSIGRAYAWWIAFAGIIVLAIIVRVWLLARSNWMMDGDEATMALVGREIQADGIRPIFFPGQAYMGVWQAYLVAGLFELFGMSRPVAKLVPLFSSAVFTATTALLARRIYDRQAALIAGLIAALPSVYFMSTTLRLSYPLIDVMAIGNLVLLLGITMTYRETISRNELIRGALLIGLLTGLAFWLHSAIAMYAAPVALLLLLRWPRRSLSLAAPALFAGFIVGALPVLNHARQYEYTLFHYLRGNEQDVSQRDYLAIAEHLFAHLLPRYLGASVPWQNTALLLQFAVALPTVGAIGYLIARSWRAPLRWIRFRPQETHPEVVVLLFGLLVLVTYIVSRFSVYALMFPSVDATGRYVAPLGTLVPIAVAGTVWHLGRLGNRGRLAGASILVLIVGGTIVNYAVADAERIFQSPYYRKLPPSNAELIATLDRLGVDAVWADHWVGKPLMFDSGLNIAAADYVDLRVWGGIDRHPEQTRRVFADDRPAYVFVNDEDGDRSQLLQNTLRQRRIAFEVAQPGAYTVILPVRQVDPADVVDDLTAAR